MRKEQLEYAAARYGTPLYVYDLDMLREEAERISAALGPEISLCYAMKANPFLTERMAEYTDRIEVCSRGEYEICRTLGIPPERLLISGVLKKKEDLFAILGQCGERSRYTVESVRQFHYLAEWSDAHAVTIGLYLRLTSGNQFGMDEATLLSIIELVNMSPYLEIEGIHYFSGTQKRTLKQLEKEICYLDELFRRLKENHQFEVRSLEYGPGTAVPYFRGKEAETFRDDGFQRLAELFGQMQWKGRITVEMGRAFTAMCGYYLTEVQDIKKNGEVRYCIVDGGNHQINYDGQIKGMYEPYVDVLPGENLGQPKKWTVCGALCTVNDVLCRDISLPGIKTGKVLVFGRTGAYSSMEGMALFLSHPLPGAVSYEEREGWRILRQKQDTYPVNMPGEAL